MLLPVGLFLAAIVLLVAVFSARKPKPLKRPDLDPPHRRRQPGAHGRQGRQAPAVALRVYVPPSEPTPTPTPTDPDLSNVIQMSHAATHHDTSSHPAVDSHCTSSDGGGFDGGGGCDGGSSGGD